MSLLVRGDTGEGANPGSVPGRGASGTSSASGARQFVAVAPSGSASVLGAARKRGLSGDNVTAKSGATASARVSKKQKRVAVPDRVVCGHAGTAGVTSGELLTSEAADKSCSVCGERSVERGPKFAVGDTGDGHLAFRIGDGLLETDVDGTIWPQGRYRITGLLGEGTFGRVVECWDRKFRMHVAVKIVRALQKYTQAARVEVQVLEKLRANDPLGKFHCVELLSWFDYLGHVCMVFEKLGANLYECLRRRAFRPFSLRTLRNYAFQILEAVEYTHAMNLIHTDLKPENVLSVSDSVDTFGEETVTALTERDELRNISSPEPPAQSSFTTGVSPGAMDSYDALTRDAVRLIDFGSAVYDQFNLNFVVSTRHYRAPEVILGLGWTFPCDLWSVGCILAELYTGKVLFQTHENLEHLAMMSALLGPMPQRMAREACNGAAESYFEVEPDGRVRLRWPEGAKHRKSILAVKRMGTLSQLIRSHGPLSSKKNLSPAVAEEHSHFTDLLEKLLSFEPGARYTSIEALQHPFFASLYKYKAFRLRDRPLTQSPDDVSSA